jgi:hypothetical protein
MRSFLFHAVARTIGFQIIVIEWLTSVSRLILGKAGYFFMNAIDPTLLKTFSGVLEQNENAEALENQQLELKLLTGASQIRDHAAETGDWTDRHSEAIAAIGDALMEQMNWEEDAVHQYLREVVESIDGLVYEVED